MPIFSGDKDPVTPFEAGNSRACAELYSVWYGKLFNYGRKFSADEGIIEDVIQDIFLTIWQQGSLHVRSLGSYLFTAFRNNLFRRIGSGRQNTPELIPEEYDFHIELAADQQMIRDERQKENARKIAKAMDGLTARQREFIFLKFYQQLSYEEVASVMNISVKAVYKLASRTIHVLRGELESEQFMLIATLLV
ncbi:MAG TPA: sigma-70 family RNA polymerase sigma factor [Anseongella sp.]|nr:sigma-70 family RNA polymerase sigma factor [Anseongella sp.]